MACQDCVNFLLSIDKFKEKIIATHWKLHKRIMTVTEPKENKGKKLDPVLIDDKDEETNIRAKSPSTADDGLIEDIPDLFCSDDEIEMEEKSSEFQKPSDTPAPVPSHSVKEPPTISLSANNPENPGETQEEKEDSDEDFLPEVPPPSTFIKEDKSKRWRYPKEMQVRLAAEDKLEEEMYRMGLFKCRICLEVTGNLTLLTKHVRTKHNPTEYIFCCTQNLRSAGRVHLFDHIREHLDQDVFKCQHCPARFSVRTRLHAHLYRFHPKEKNRMFLCDTCGRGFAIKGQLDQHVKVKHNSTEWKCDRCDKVYKSKYPLKIHMDQDHDKISTFVCELCGKGFSTNHRLRAHISYHGDEYAIGIGLQAAKKKIKKARMDPREAENTHSVYDAAYFNS